MTEFIILTASIFLFCFIFYWFSKKNRKLSRTAYSTSFEKEKLRPYEKYCNRDYILDRASGKFFHLDYETPVEGLSSIIAQTSLYHNCFISFSGKIRVRITHFFYSESSDQVIAICRADLSLVLSFEKKACHQYFLFDEHLKIFLQVCPKRNGTMEYFYPEYAHEIEGGKFKLEIMLRDCKYGGQTNIYLKRNPKEYFNGRYD